MLPSSGLEQCGNGQDHPPLPGQPTHGEGRLGAQGGPLPRAWGAPSSARHMSVNTRGMRPAPEGSGLTGPQWVPREAPPSHFL